MGLDLDSTTSSAWDRLIEEQGQGQGDVESILVCPEGTLARKGAMLDDPALRGYVQWKLEQSLPRPSSSSSSPSHNGADSGQNSKDEAYNPYRSRPATGNGTWRKLAISSWAPSLGLGTNVDNKTDNEDDNHNVNPHKLKETPSASSSNSGSGKWGGIGQWFGMTLGTPPVSSSVSSEPAEQIKLAESGRLGTDRVDLVSLHSALESEAGEQEVEVEVEVGKLGWTVEKVWMDRGTVEVTLAYVIVSDT
jgi:hypothetical protein